MQQTSFYLTRLVDRQLQEAVRNWLKSSNNAGWISLRSAPGRGNTSLFSHFESNVREDEHFFGQTRRLYIPGPDRDPTRPPGDIEPFAKALFELHSKVFSTRWSQLRRRLANAGLGRIVLGILRFAIYVAVGVTLIALGQYAATPTKVTSTSWWHDFFVGFLPGHLHDLPLWVATTVLPGLFLSKRILGLPEVAPISPKAQELPRFRDLYGAVPGILEDLCRGSSALIVFVDDAYAQCEELKKYLQDLHGPLKSQDALREFRRTHRVLVVTLDIAADRPAGRKTVPAIPFDVPAFSLLEVRDIASALSINVSDREGIKLEQARSNINRLTNDDDEELRGVVGHQFHRSVGEARDPEFGAPHILALCALSGWSHVSAKQIEDWLDPSSSDLVASFYDLLHRENSRAKSDVVQALRKSICLRRDGRTYYFNERAFRDLRMCLEEEYSDLLSQAHYFWMREAGDKVRAHGIDLDNLGSTANATRPELKRAAWHAAALGAIHKLPMALLEGSRLQKPAIVAHAHEAAALLLEAAAAYAQEGALAEARRAIVNALNWIPEEDSKQLREAALFALWQIYLSSADKDARTLLQASLDQYGEIATTPVWRVCGRFEDFLEGWPVSDDRSVSDIMSSRLRNLANCAETHISIRKTYGLDLQSLDNNWVVAVAQPDRCVTRSEFHLLQWSVRAAVRAKDEAAIQNGFVRWSARLQEVRPTDGSAAADGLHSLCEGAFYADALSLRTRRTPEQDSDLGIPDQYSDADLFQMSLSLYQRAAQIGDLLDLYPLRAEALFYEGLLWKDLGPKYLSEKQDDWLSWEEIWESCLKAEAQTGWMYFTPLVHYLRWQWFSQQRDQPASLDDLLNFYRSIKTVATFPFDWILWSNHNLRRELPLRIDAKHALIYAELFETWAREYAALPDAERFRTYPGSPAAEQFHSLLFAAQGFRIAGELQRAGQVLADAESIFADNKKEITDLGQVFQMKIQKAWLAGVKGDTPSRDALIAEVWGELRPTATVAAVVLKDIVEIEKKQGLLGGLWPVSEEVEPWIDPANEQFNLPSGWFTDPPICHVSSRFEFRLHQLTHLVSEERYPEQSALDASASADWYDQDSFDRVVLEIGDRGLDFTLHPLSEALIIRLLRAVVTYYNSVQRNLEGKLGALELLCKYEPASKSYQQECFQIRTELKRLKDREKQHQYKWMDAVQDWFDRMSVYEDQGLRDRILATQLSAELMAAMQEREESAIPLLTKFAGGKFDECLKAVLVLIPQGNLEWVQKEDLLLVDLGIRCAAQLGGAAQEYVPELKRQLRELSSQYLKQKRQAMGDEESQRLTFELVDQLQELRYSDVSAAPVGNSATASG